MKNQQTFSNLYLAPFKKFRSQSAWKASGSSSASSSHPCGIRDTKKFSNLSTPASVSSSRRQKFVTHLLMTSSVKINSQLQSALYFKTCTEFSTSATKMRSPFVLIETIQLLKPLWSLFFNSFFYPISQTLNILPDPQTSRL